MADGSRPDAMVTPEGVALALETATIGSRFIATVWDTLILTALNVVLYLAFGSSASSGLRLGVYAALVFFLFVAYYTLFEALWGGRTPGKASQKLRVVQRHGQPVTLGAAAIRNLIRIVDLLPGLYAIAIVSVLVTRGDQRLGDLAAGTYVVHDSDRDIPKTFDGPLPAGSKAASLLDASAIGDREYQLARSYLQRRFGLDAGSRARVAREVATALRVRLGGASGELPDETLIEAVVAAHRARQRDLE